MRMSNLPIDVNFSTAEDGRTALHLAAISGHIRCMETLLGQRTIKVNAQDSQGNTPLHLAVARSHLGAVKLLLDAGASTFIKNATGNRPSDYAKDRDIETLLGERKAAIRQSPSITQLRTPQMNEWESLLPHDIKIIRPFCLELLAVHTVFQERCKETIRQLIEEKHIALHKNRLLEQAAGIQDRETSERFIDQLQYWQDENEKQASTVAYLKMRVELLENDLAHQEEYYRKNLADLTKQHTEQVRAIYRRNEETEKQFLAYQKAHSEEQTELVRLRSEVASLSRGKPIMKGDSASELQALRKEVADLKAEKTALDSKLKLAENLKGMVEKENMNLRDDMNKLRKAAQEEVLKTLNEAREEKDENDESSGDVIFIKGESGTTKRIKGATPDKLVERLIDPTIHDHEFQQTLLLTHKIFMTSSEFLDIILQKYTESKAAVSADQGVAGQTPLLLRVVNTFRSWLEQFWSDFVDDPTLLEKVTAFADRMKDDNLSSVLKSVITRKLTPSDAPQISKSLAPPPKPLLPKVLAKRYSHETAARGLGHERPSSMGPWAPFAKSKLSDLSEETIKLKLTDIEPLELARQITLIEFNLFKAIKPRELLDLAWMKDDKETRAPNITCMSRWSNHMIHWIVSEIVTVKESSKARAAIFERFVITAQYLERLNNYNAVKEVLAALQSSSVYRLKKTKETVSNKCMRVYEELTKMTSSELNYKNLRAKVHAAEPPVIPFPGVYQGDLVFLDTCQKDKLDGGLVNYSKLQKVTNYVIELQTYQQTHYSLEPIVEIQDYVRNFQVLSDDLAYNYSLVCEPRS
ncbi:hypothetical protein HK104_004763 [Borealophlyctis nickersoniae]|nr:hypothetical protein HK104_004763 [Borealophlyctis nickersoniae]